MYFVYTLHSKKDGNLYIGYTENLQRRFVEHQEGKVMSTKHRLPIELIYYEAYLNQDDAKGREKFLKSGSGHRFLKKQLVHHFSSRSQQ